MVKSSSNTKKSLSIKILNIEFSENFGAIPWLIRFADGVSPINLFFKERYLCDYYIIEHRTMSILTAS